MSWADNLVGIGAGSKAWQDQVNQNFFQNVAETVKDVFFICCCRWMLLGWWFCCWLQRANVWEWFLLKCYSSSLTKVLAKANYSNCGDFLEENSSLHEKQDLATFICHAVHSVFQWDSKLWGWRVWQEKWNGLFTKGMMPPTASCREEGGNTSSPQMC